MRSNYIFEIMCRRENKAPRHASLARARRWHNRTFLLEMGNDEPPGAGCNVQSLLFEIVFNAVVCDCFCWFVSVAEIGTDRDLYQLLYCWPL